MKIKFSVFFLFLVYIPLKSQVASIVHDPKLAILESKNAIIEKEQLEESIIIRQSLQEQKATLKEIENFWEKAENTLKKVNSNLNDVIYVKTISNRMIEIVNMQSEAVSEISKFNHLSKSEKEEAIYQLNGILSDTRKLATLSKDLLTSDLFNMSDSQRIELLMKIDEDIKQRQDVLMETFYTYQRINDERETMDLMINW